MALLSAKDKGKARASEDFEESTYYDPPSAVGGEDSRSTLDYETALESALYDVSDSSTNRHHGTNGSNIQEPDEDEEFIYNGKDDEDMRVFQEDARLESLDYKERLRSVLGDAAEVEEPGGLDDVGVSRMLSVNNKRRR